MKTKICLWFVAIGLILLPLTLQAADVGDEMPSFSITTLAGKVVKSSNLIGKKPVFFVFWATWCPNCKAEIPHINEMAKEFTPLGMEFIGVNVGVNDSEKKVERFAKKYQIQYPLYFDKGSQLTRKFKVSGTPTVIIVDKGGIIRYRGVTPPQDLAPNFDELNK